MEDKTDDNQPTDYERAIMAKYQLARRILICNEELEALSVAAVSAIKNNWCEVAGELARSAAHKALVLLECKAAIERVFGNGSN